MKTYKLIITIFMLLVIENALAEIITGSSNARILQTITLSEKQPLNFGVILPDLSGDTIILSESLVSSSGKSVFSGGHSYAIFTINGVPNSLVSVQISDSATLSGPGEPMIVNNFTEADWNPILDAEGLHTLHIGASLSINSNQLPGIYQGTYNLTANYQ